MEVFGITLQNGEQAKVGVSFGHYYTKAKDNRRVTMCHVHLLDENEESKRILSVGVTLPTTASKVSTRRDSMTMALLAQPARRVLSKENRTQIWRQYLSHHNI